MRADMRCRPADDLFNAVQENGARCLKRHFLLVHVELPDCKAAAAREAAERV
jgi:hypothetical protein